jgi:hypothetical protein
MGDFRFDAAFFRGAGRGAVLRAGDFFAAPRPVDFLPPAFRAVPFFAADFFAGERFLPAILRRELFFAAMVTGSCRWTRID